MNFRYHITGQEATPWQRQVWPLRRPEKKKIGPKEREKRKKGKKIREKPEGEFGGNLPELEGKRGNWALNGGEYGITKTYGSIGRDNHMGQSWEGARKRKKTRSLSASNGPKPHPEWAGKNKNLDGVRI